MKTVSFSSVKRFNNFSAEFHVGNALDREPEEELNIDNKDILIIRTLGNINSLAKSGISDSLSKKIIRYCNGDEDVIFSGPEKAQCNVVIPNVARDLKSEIRAKIKALEDKLDTLYCLI